MIGDRFQSIILAKELGCTSPVGLGDNRVLIDTMVGISQNDYLYVLLVKRTYVS